MKLGIGTARPDYIYQYFSISFHIAPYCSDFLANQLIKRYITS